MKKIGFWTAISLVVGNILGVGIFTTMGYLTNYIHNPYHILLAWLTGAVYAFSGSKVYGLLAQKMPYRGGDYVYLKKHFHPYFSYLFGWSGLFITYTGSIAALGIGAAHYFNELVPCFNLAYEFFSFELLGFTIGLDGFKLFGIMIILLFTHLNYLGIRTGGVTQNVLTGSIVTMMLLFILFGYFSGADQLIPIASDSMTTELSNFFTALVAVLFTFMGWTTIVYIANEIENAERVIPKALVTGTLAVVVLYMAINYVFLSTFPARELTDVINAASKVAGKLWGIEAKLMVAAMILVAILSSLNSTVLSGPRIYQAMAADGYLWQELARMHKRYDTPYHALWAQGLWSGVLLFSGTFNQLLTIVVAAILLFSIFSAIVSLKILISDRIQGIALWIYNIIYLFLCAIILINILINQFLESLIGFLILSISLPFYFYQSKR